MKRRLLINSLTILGACAGAAIYPLLSEYLTTKYTLNGALFVLSGIQLNCLVGSMFLREPTASAPLSLFGRTKRNPNRATKKNADSINEPNSLKRTKHSHMKNRSSSSAHLIEKDETNYKEEQNNKPTKISNDIEMTSTTKHTSKYKKLDPSMSPKRSNPRPRRIDSETESTTSTSTATITNYTIKQYWRKFVQTRKSQANAKKNLFHLIAEEKKKTRTLSKTSLEDGFVITTSNNLLAPNDESHVIITSRQAKLAQQNAATTATHNNLSTQQPVSATSRAASRFFTRIANSIRSLGQSNQNQSPLHTTTHSKNQLDAARNTSVLDFGNNNNKQTVAVQLTEKLTAVDSPSNTKKNQPELQSIPTAAASNVSSSTFSTSSSTPLPLIPLMSVFSGPLPPETLQQQSISIQPPVLSSEPVVEKTVEVTAIQANTNSVSQNDETNSNEEEFNRFDECDDDEEDSYEENELDDKEIQAHKSQLSRKLNSTSNNPNSNVYKMSRYLSYRNSLTNSVRGSLLECSVPEDREEHEPVSNGNDANDEENNKQLGSHRNSGKRRIQRMQEANKNSTLLSLSKTGNDHAGSNNGKYLMNGRNNNSGFRATFISARRLISTIDGASFFNLPLNLETIENNIKNSFIVKKSSYYQRHQYQNKTPIYYNSDTKNTSTLFLLYLGYITNFKVFLNPLLMVLNFAFFLNIIGK